MSQLSEKDMSYIVAAIASFPEIDKAVLFGSRAKGSARPCSDLDIAIYGLGVTFSTLAKLHWLLEEESPMPYFVDVVDYGAISNVALREHIDRVGVVIFVRA